MAHVCPSAGTAGVEVSFEASMLVLQRPGWC